MQRPEPQSSRPCHYFGYRGKAEPREKEADHRATTHVRKNQFFDSLKELREMFLQHKSNDPKVKKIKPVYIHSEKYENIEKLLRKTGRTLKISKKEDKPILKKYIKRKRVSRSDLRAPPFLTSSRLNEVYFSHSYID